MIGRRTDGSEAAFTLLEMLVAVTVFAVIASLLYGTLARTARSRRYAVEREQVAARARAALSWLGRDLESSFQSEIYPSGNKVFFSSGLADTPASPDGDWLLDTTALSSRGTVNLDLGRLPAGPATATVDQARILYRLEAPPDSTSPPHGLDLVRYEIRPPLGSVDLEAAARSVVADHIDYVSLRFFDGVAWHDSWDAAEPGPTRGRAPRAVEIEIAVADADGRVFPFVSAVEVPSTESSSGGER
ncbi:MAG: prepilin-type N-terminal cleavage/methylation domain-containing protein [Deltaproteobacteria bacterium]|nr:MAG: prepilin-type N-terminal cleavage/methylation domain-containing protein [Deltaproteobacteria bacterium]